MQDAIPLMRGVTAAAVAGILVVFTRQAAAQLPDSVVSARLDSSSICPSVTVAYHANSMSSDIRTSPLLLQAGPPRISVVVSLSELQRAKRGPFATFSVLAVTSGPQLFDNDSVLVVTADESIRLTMMTRHTNVSRPDGTNIESTFGQMPATDLQLLKNASRVAIEFSGKTYSLTLAEVQAVRAAIGEIGKPASNRDVATGCSGPRAKLAAPVAVMMPQMSLQRDTAGGLILVPIGPEGTHSGTQVDKPARVASDFPRPKYPPTLSKWGIEGTVTAEFTVLENGTADMDTFKVLKSSNEEFSTSVRDFVRSLRFIPAEKSGHAVRQVVQFPFAFKVNH